MRWIKLFESFKTDISDIDNTCKEYGITNYTINDGKVDVEGDVNLAYKIKGDKLAIKFGKIKGDFLIARNNLKTLEGCPDYVDGTFIASSVSNLVGCPREVTGDFMVFHCGLTSLEGAPDKIGGEFLIEDTPVYGIWLAMDKDYSKMELYNEFDPIRGKDIIVDRLNGFLSYINKPDIDHCEVEMDGEHILLKDILIAHKYNLI